MFTGRKISFRAVGMAVLVSGIGVGSFVAGRAGAEQNHMKNALRHLQDAREALQNADEDKGGHRLRAVKLVKDAIDEVQEGMKFDRRHGKGRD